MTTNFHFHYEYGLTELKDCLTRDDIRRRLGPKFDEVPKSPFEEDSMDAFDGAALKAFYDAANLITGVELCFPWAHFWFGDKQVLGMTVADFRDFMSHRKLEVTKSDDGCSLQICKDALKFYVPDPDDMGERAIVEAVYLDIPYRGICPR